MSTMPKNVEADRAQGALRITWMDNVVSQYPFVALRGLCCCAGCVDEHTGERLLDFDSIPADISVENMQLVGNYGLRIHWSDGHNTGLYTWSRLRDVAEEPLRS
jgi:DUF971 family protein